MYDTIKIYENMYMNQSKVPYFVMLRKLNVEGRRSGTYGGA